MARIIKESQEWTIKCWHCGAVIAYMEKDISTDYHSGNRRWEKTCECPSCNDKIKVPKYEAYRTLA